MGYLLWHYLRESAQRHGSGPAVEWRHEVLTYRELDDQSTRLAVALRAQGIGPGDRVGLHLPKSVRCVVAMHGILKTGAAYVPVDPNAPPRRAAYILNDCTVKALVSTGRKLQQLKEFLSDITSLSTMVLVDEATTDNAVPTAEPRQILGWNEALSTDPAEWTEPDSLETDPAYLLYTSGSTGSPKGVILSHRHACTFVDWAVETFGVTPEDRLANHAALHFDLSVFDIYAALRSGACVVHVPDEVTAFPVQLASWIDSAGISIWYSVPSALVRLLLHGDIERFDYRNLRTILYAGEVFPVKHLRRVMERFEHVRFFNLYGPTETNVCTYHPLPRTLGPEVIDIPIGKACANSEVFALDERGLRVGPGESGELYVRGPSLLLGYWGQPEKTQLALVRNPLQPAYEELVYRTGDIVRLEADGSYSFVGRRDHMVKSRGYRIELGEVEQVIYQHPKVKEAVVLALPDEEIGSRLHAVVVPNDGQELAKGDLQSFCLARLPGYMVPEELHFRTELPRTSTGKSDRVALSQDLLGSRS